MFVLRNLAATTLVCSVAFVFPAVGQEKKAPADKPIADGSYFATSGEREGKALTDEQIKGVIFRFDGDKMTITDRTGKELHKCTHTFDAASKPVRITMKMADTSGDKTVVGLVEREGDVVKIIYPLAGGETPTEFKTKAKQEMYTLKMQQ